MKTIDTTKYKELINSLEFSMSKFQIERFVLNEQLTDYKKLKQALVEYNSRLNIYEQNLCDIDIQECNISDIELDIEEFENNIDNTMIDSITDRRNKNYIKSKNAELKKSQLQLAEFIKNQNNILFELSVFEKNIEELLTLISSDRFLEIASNEKLKDSYEEDYWVKRFATNAFTDIMCSGNISNGLLQSILNMPENTIGMIFQDAITKKLTTENTLNIQGQIAFDKVQSKNEFE